MRRIPLYDATAPITCSIGDDEVPERIELVARLRTNLRHLERTEHGLRLHFPVTAAIERDLRTFAVDEKRCCGFWGFAVESGGGDLILRWDGPPAADDLLDRLAAYFDGDEPLATITGLL